MLQTEKLTPDNYTAAYLQFQRRQAGVNLVYCPESNRFFYNAYCLEIDLLKELVAVEFDFLEDALDMINSDFGSWDLKEFDSGRKNCGSCVAKKPSH